MKIKITLIAIISLIGQLIYSQKNIPIIKSNSKKIDIRDGKILSKQSWNISPELNPDIYETSSLGQKVTFITDKDSITIKIKKNTKFDFIILLNDSIKARTQVVYKYVPNFLEKLKGASKYNLTEKQESPNFTYQDKDNPNLVALRKGYNLDSIAGNANQTTKIINLLHWIHNLVPHDGNHENPTVKNASSMISVCKSGKRGLNCRGLATVLNECFLSLGMKSRFVTCMPKELNFDDCHVINMVYLEDQKKWIWIDPTHNSYVMNEKGELLSIQEVRERLINDKPLILNPDANWNNKNSDTKEEHLYSYMAKNLYRFQCPLASEYDSETLVDGKKIEYLELIPLDGLEQTPKKKEQTNTKTNTKFAYYKTNNPNIFWAEPTK